MRRPSVIAGGVAFLIIALLSHLRATPYNNYVLLAQALLAGHVWIDWPGAYIDALLFNGQHYIIEAPLPALLLLPAVAVFGAHANQTLLGAILAAVAVGATWELGERYAVPHRNIAWICAFFLAGTDLLWCAMLGDVWFLAHVSACCFTMLALVELAGKRRGWIVALFAACAVGSRFSLIAALPVYAYLLSAGSGVVADGAQRRSVPARSLVGFAAVLIVAAVCWATYNEARWGTWNDIGYATWYHQDQAGMPSGSPFRPMYLPMQLWSFFVQWPTFLPAFPWLRPELSGVALTWTSPALLLALLARAPWRWTVALWAAAVLVALPNMLYYVNGFAQFGMRHALDFEPFLVALMLLAVRVRFPRWAYVLATYSIIAGLWGCWYWLAFVRT